MADKPLPDWDEIVKSHAPRVFRVALRVLGSVQDAEDISQEVFIEAIRAHRTAPVRNWTGFLVRLATLRSIDHVRRSRDFVELRETDGVSGVEPFERAAAAELAAILRRGIARLPEQQAAVFVMRYFDELSREDIAEALRISPVSVSSALYKARQRLQDHLAALNRGEAK